MIKIDTNKCISCKKCVNDCTAHAIDIENFTVSTLCIACGHCVAICPQRAVTMNDKPVVELQAQTVTSQDFRNLCAHTRSCRHFTKQTISDDILQKLVEITAQAPSASNVRGVELTVITNKDLLKKINADVSNELLKMFRLLTRPVIKQIVQLITSKQQVIKLKNYVAKFEKAHKEGKQNITFNAPALVLFHAKHETLGMLETDASIWATYMSLYASSFGLGTCFNGFISKSFGKNKSLQKQFGIPENHKVYISLMVGYSAVKYANEVSRDAAKIAIV
ncbi:MAG: nitroreductase family protein [Bacteroidales bacterium]|jgi:nitroreductase/NAD-dependent dihydropyrimidine dehydrogenase PreA subunit|nr:nitroreductase family protein [Bacteroidales bacterium]